MQVAQFDPKRHFLVVTRRASADLCRAAPALRDLPLAQLRRLLIAVVADGEERERWDTELGTHVLVRSRLTGATRLECEVELLWSRLKNGQQRLSPNKMPVVQLLQFRHADE